MSSVALLPASYLHQEEEADLGTPCDLPRISTFGDHTKADTPRTLSMADRARALYDQLTWANCQLSVVFLLFVVLRAMDRVFNKRVIDRMKSALQRPTRAPAAFLCSTTDRR